MSEQNSGGRIVVGVDASDSSMEALRWAVRQADLTGASVEATIAWHYPLLLGGYAWPPFGMLEDCDFPAQAGKLLAETVLARNAGLPMDVIDDAIKLNHALVHQPFARTNLAVALRYDILDYWYKVRTGEQAVLREQPMLVEIDRTSRPYDDFQKWCREIVWWGNKKGAYLYSPTAREITPELAGHY